MFKPEDYQRHIDTALADYSRRKPLQCLGELTLAVGGAVYDCPAALLTLQGLDWGATRRLGSTRGTTAGRAACRNCG